MNTNRAVLLGVVALLFAATPASGTSQRAEALERARTLYKRGDFAAAARVIEGVLSTGTGTDPELHARAGDAWYAAEWYGAAAAHYEAVIAQPTSAIERETAIGRLRECDENSQPGRLVLLFAEGRAPESVRATLNYRFKEDDTTLTSTIRVDGIGKKVERELRLDTGIWEFVVDDDAWYSPHAVEVRVEDRKGRKRKGPLVVELQVAPRRAASAAAGPAAPLEIAKNDRPQPPSTGPSADPNPVVHRPEATPPEIRVAPSMEVGTGPSSPLEQGTPGRTVGVGPYASGGLGLALAASGFVARALSPDELGTNTYHDDVRRWFRWNATGNSLLWGGVGAGTMAAVGFAAPSHDQWVWWTVAGGGVAVAGGVVLILGNDRLEKSLDPVDENDHAPPPDSTLGQRGAAILGLGAGVALAAALQEILVEEAPVSLQIVPGPRGIGVAGSW